MKVVFEASFARDLKKIREKPILARVEQAISGVNIYISTHHSPPLEPIGNVQRLLLQAQNL